MNKLYFIMFFLVVSVPSVFAAQDAGNLHAAIVSACGCSVVSVSIGNPADSNTWKVQYGVSATAVQVSAGNAVVAGFNPNATAVPYKIDAMQAKVALSRAGLLTAVQNWINTQSAEDQLVWNTAPAFRRDSALIAAGMAALGITSAQMDQLFISAAAINP